VDRTATWVAKSANPPQFEDKIRENQRNDPKFSFLNPVDPYHAYYRHRIERVSAGEGDETAATAGDTSKDGAAPTGEAAVPEAPKDIGVEPPAANFILELPSMTSIDLLVFYH
jgi:splicing factor 3A subunit 1